MICTLFNTSKSMMQWQEGCNLCTIVSLLALIVHDMVFISIKISLYKYISLLRWMNEWMNEWMKCIFPLTCPFVGTKLPQKLTLVQQMSPKLLVKHSRVQRNLEDRLKICVLNVSSNLGPVQLYEIVTLKTYINQLLPTQITLFCSSEN